MGKVGWGISVFTLTIPYFDAGKGQGWNFRRRGRFGWVSRAATPHPPSPHCRPSLRPWLFVCSQGLFFFARAWRQTTPFPAPARQPPPPRHKRNARPPFCQLGKRAVFVHLIPQSPKPRQGFFVWVGFHSLPR